jgi:hypothetical protein
MGNKSYYGACIHAVVGEYNDREARSNATHDGSITVMINSFLGELLCYNIAGTR